MDSVYMLLIIIPLVIVLVAQALVSGTYGKYKLVKNRKQLTGFDVARKILDTNGLRDIKVVETRSFLGDHYDPRRKVVRLSSEVYHSDNIASLAIAAHECGHAIQHKNKYVFILIRSFLVPIVNFASKIGYVVLFIGFLSALLDIALIGLILLSGTLLFQLVTLPVEFDASGRAKKILIKENMITDEEKNKVSAMLNAAAITYVASLIANLLEILRLFLMINRRR